MPKMTGKGRGGRAKAPAKTRASAATTTARKTSAGKPAAKRGRKKAA